MSEIDFNKAYITLTSKCNLQCDYCYVKQTDDKELSTSEWKKIFKILSKHNVKTVQLTGGEPLTRDDFWEILDDCYKRFDQVILATNAMLIDEKEISKFSKYEKLIFYISLNKWVEKEEKSIDYEKIKIIKNLKKHGKIVCVLTTVSNDNFKSLPKIIDFVQKNKLQWKLGFISLVGCADRNMLDPVTRLFLEDFKENLRDINISVIPPCEAGFYTISVLENGDVTPCVAAREKEYVAGNILKDDLVKIFDSDVFKQWREESSRIDASCVDCDIFSECKGGCPIRRFSYTKSYDKKILVDAGMCAWNQSFERLGLESRVKRMENNVEL